MPVLTGLSPHLRLQSDERLVALVRRGHQGAFEVLMRRYHARLLAFCRHMLRSNEDAEDVLQEVFASAYRAICADDRPIKARPWLYRIARNRCLNHLRRPQDAGHDTMDVFEREAGATAADTVHRREEFRQIIADVQELPEAQRAALLLREIDALSYDQIAEAMETTVPSVKSLLVRARMSLAEAAEARHLTCGEVRLQLTQAAEGITDKPPPTIRRHVRSCSRCRTFKRELRRTSHALAALYPIGPLVAAKSLLGLKLGGAAASAGGSTAGGGATLMGGGAAGALSAASGSAAAKAAAGVAAAALVTAGAVEVKRAGGDPQATGDPSTSALAPDPIIERSDPPVSALRHPAPQPVEPSPKPAPPPVAAPTPPVVETTPSEAPAEEAEPVPEEDVATTESEDDAMVSQGDVSTEPGTETTPLGTETTTEPAVGGSEGGGSSSGGDSSSSGGGFPGTELVKPSG